jgi:hypothetical protein
MDIGYRQSSASTASTAVEDRWESEKREGGREMIQMVKMINTHLGEDAGDDARTPRGEVQDVPPRGCKPAGRCGVVGTLSPRGLIRTNATSPVSRDYSRSAATWEATPPLLIAESKRRRCDVSSQSPPPRGWWLGGGGKG